MIDTDSIRKRFVGVRDVEPWVVPALCIEVDGTRALLAEAKAALSATEARAEKAEAEATAFEEQLTAREKDWDDEHARAERLAAYAQARKAADEAATKRGDTWAIVWREKSALADALYDALQPGDVTPAEDAEPQP
jgi:predicted  nucleic acid-binding Zn-ribbon protein